MAPKKQLPLLRKSNRGGGIRKAKHSIKRKIHPKKSTPNMKLKGSNRGTPKAKLKYKKPSRKTPRPPKNAKNKRAKLKKSDRGVRKGGVKKAKHRAKKRPLKNPLQSKKPKVKVRKKGMKVKPHRNKVQNRHKQKKPKAHLPKRLQKSPKLKVQCLPKPVKTQGDDLKRSKNKASIEAEQIPVIKGSAVIQGRKLGEGGFGKVVEGIFQGRTVAVKIPLRKADFEEALVEFKKLRNFRHRNVVEAIAYCKDPAMFVMEFMAGGTLNSWLHDGNNKYTPMNWFQGLALLTDISRGVKLLHDVSLLHGDLSSNNVLLTRDHTTAKISDFGTVQMIEKYINASLAGQIDEAVGAFRWMAPQRLRFSKPDNYSDVWSYGCILMEFLTHPRKIPFAVAGTGQLIAKLESYVEGDVRDLHIDLGEMDPDAPPVLQELMYRCLKAKRVERPDYGQIVDELEYVHNWLVKKHAGGHGKLQTNNKRIHSTDTRTWR